MSAAIHRHPSAPVVPPRVRAQIMLDAATGAASDLAAQSEQVPDKLRAELLACIANEQWGAAVLLLARLSTHDRARSE
jgi:hypothetical protein